MKREKSGKTLHDNGSMDSSLPQSQSFASTTNRRRRRNIYRRWKAFPPLSLEPLAYFGRLAPIQALSCRLTKMTLYKQHLGGTVLSFELVSDIRRKMSVVRHITSNYRSCVLVTILYMITLFVACRH